MLERPNGQLIVRYEGRRVATQEPPPRMGALCDAGQPRDLVNRGPNVRRVVSGRWGITTSAGPIAVAVWPLPLEPVRPAETVVKPVAGKNAAAKDTVQQGTRTRRTSYAHVQPMARNQVEGNRQKVAG